MILILNPFSYYTPVFLSKVAGQSKQNLKQNLYTKLARSQLSAKIMYSLTVAENLRCTENYIWNQIVNQGQMES